MRINLTKKELVNAIYMQLGFSKLIAENLIDDLLFTVTDNIQKEEKLKLSKFGTFTIRVKNLELDEIQKQKKLKWFQKEKLFYLELQKNLKIS